MRVAFLTNMVSPYRAPALRALGATPGWTLRVFVDVARESDRAEWAVQHDGLDVELAGSFTVRRTVRCEVPVPFTQTRELHLPWKLFAKLRRFRPDVLIAHELGARSLVAAAYAKAFKVPLVIWSYHSAISATQGAWRDGLRARLLAQATHVVGMGRQARQVLEGWGVEGARIVDCPNAPDVSGFTRQLTAPDHADRVAALRAEFGGGRKLALVSGRLVPLKGTPRLLELWRSLPADLRRDWRLVFVGDGPLRPLVEGAGDGVRAVGGLPPDRLAAYYAAADLHVFPSFGDVWGLVVNEASLCGTPSLCSTHAACAADLIEHGRDGLVFDPTASDAGADLEAALRRDDLPLLGAAARRVARACTPERLAGAFRQAAQRAAA